MSKIASYEDLDVWNLSMDLCEAVYRATEAMPSEEKFALTAQIRRSAVSIPSNIAEGSGRFHTRELIQFLGVADGSLCELETQLKVAKRIKVLADISELLHLCSRVGQMLARLRQSLLSRPSK